jgi:cell division transport system permease protein
MFIDKILNFYEERLNSEYSLIVVSDKGVTKSDIIQSDTIIKSAELISIEKVLDKIKQQISSKNIYKIKNIVPLFYTVKLRRYTDAERIEILKKNILKINGVKSVHAFEDMHDKMYEILSFFKTNISIFIILISIISFLLMIKQMTIWQLEHYERMQIMALFGAPVWLRSTILIKLAIVDATLALLMTIGVIYYIINQPQLLSVISELGMTNISSFWHEDISMLAAISYGVALISTLWVIVRFKEH